MARSSPGVLRVAAILNFIAAHPGQSFTLTDLVKALKLSRATCHALLTGLVDVGYLYRASDKNYVLGPTLAAVGRIAAQHSSPLQVAEPEMRALADEFDAICAAYFREHDDLILRSRAASVSNVGWSVPVGYRTQLRPPFGSIFYAWSPASVADQWLDSCNPAPTAEHREQMTEDMAFVRRCGFQVHIRNQDDMDFRQAPERAYGSDRMSFPTSLLSTIDGTEAYPVAGITAPVFEHDEQIAFVLSLVGFARSLDGAEIMRIGKRLVDACDRISTFITGRRPQSTRLS